MYIYTHARSNVLNILLLCGNNETFSHLQSNFLKPLTNKLDNQQSCGISSISRTNCKSASTSNINSDCVNIYLEKKLLAWVGRPYNNNKKVVIKFQKVKEQSKQARQTKEF